MKKVVLLLLMIVSNSFIVLKGQTVNADYDRVSLTVLLIDHNDPLDSFIKNCFAQNDYFGDKYDKTQIDTKSISIGVPRFLYDEKGPASQRRSYMDGNSISVLNQLAKNKVASQIIAAWFNRSDKGEMDLSVVKSRSAYNATDATINIVESQSLGKYLLESKGLDLIGNSYVIVVDISNLMFKNLTDERGRVTSVQCSADTFGYLYKVVFSDVERQKVFDSWIYPGDSESDRMRKNRAWDVIPFSLSYVTMMNAGSGASASPNSSDFSRTGLEQACVEYNIQTLLNKIEKEVDAMKVKTSVYSTQPITAKIGTKEGLRRMDRYEVDEFILNDSGTIDARRKGFIRATSINNNSVVSEGNTGLSEFYQISGGKIEPGMQLKQRKDIPLTLRLLYSYGATSGYGLELDYASSMNSSGSAAHGDLGLFYNKYSKGLSVDGAEGLPYDIMAGTAMIGAGYGLRPIRQVEVIPTLYFISDYLDTMESSGVGAEEDAILKYAGFALGPGISMDVTLFYPIKLTGGAFYSIPIYSGEKWSQFNDLLIKSGAERLKGVTLRGGVSFEF